MPNTTTLYVMINYSFYAAKAIKRSLAFDMKITIAFLSIFTQTSDFFSMASKFLDIVTSPPVPDGNCVHDLMVGFPKIFRTNQTFSLIQQFLIMTP